VDVSGDHFMTKTTDYIGWTNENKNYAPISYTYVPSEQSPGGAISYYHGLSASDSTIAFPEVDDKISFILLNYSLSFSLTVTIDQGQSLISC
jgi:hypothetical protein